MSSNFSVSAVLVKTERSHATAKRASFERERDPFDPDGAGYAASARGVPTFAARTEKKSIARKRFRPPSDGRFFDGHH